MQLRFGVNCQTALTSNLRKFAGQIKKAATSKLATILKSKVDEEIEENTRLGKLYYLVNLPLNYDFGV